MKSGTALFRKIIWIMFVLTVVHLLTYPFCVQVIDSFTSKPISKIQGSSYWEILNQKLIATFFGLLFFSFGASLGSFLNVVAYRMPLRRSVVFNPSKCPRCDYSIEMKDNIPVLGWLLLNGECRNCNQKISSRYPIVEGICGAIFMLLYFVQLISGGKNLPIREPNLYYGVVWVVLHTKWDLVAIYVYHCSLFALLLTLTLFAVDRSRVPKRFCAIGFLLLIAPPLLLNFLIQVPYDRISANHELMDLQRTALTLVCGGFAGLAAGTFNWFLAGADHHNKADSVPENDLAGNWPVLCGWVFLGNALGWQALIGIAVILVVLGATGRAVLSRDISITIPSICWLLIAALVHHSFWRLIHIFTWNYLEHSTLR